MSVLLMIVLNSKNSYIYSSDYNCIPSLSKSWTHLSVSLLSNRNLNITSNLANNRLSATLFRFKVNIFIVSEILSIYSYKFSCLLL